MTNSLETLTKEPRRSLHTRRYAEGSVPAEIVPVNGNGKDYTYTSPEGDILNLTRTKDQPLPSIVWRPSMDESKGEFFMVINKGQKVDNLRSAVRVTVELPTEKEAGEEEIPGPTVSVENGEFRLQGTAGEHPYVEITGPTESVYANGMGPSRRANVFINPDVFVTEAYLDSYTYVGVKTRLIGKIRDYKPEQNEIGRFFVTGGYNEINGYELLASEPEGYPLAQFLAETPDRNRSGHYVELRPDRLAPEPVKPDDAATVVFSQQKKRSEEEPVVMTPALVEEKAPESEKDAAIRSLRESIQRQIARRPKLEPIYSKSELKKMQREQEQLEAEIIVTQHVDLRGKSLRDEIKEIYHRQVEIYPRDRDVEVAEVLSQIATVTDRTRPVWMTSVLTPAALGLLTAQPEQLQDMIVELMNDREGKSMTQVAWIKQKIGSEILSAIGQELVKQQQEGAETPSKRRFPFFKR